MGRGETSGWLIIWIGKSSQSSKKTKPQQKKKKRSRFSAIPEVYFRENRGRDVSHDRADVHGPRKGGIMLHRTETRKGVGFQPYGRRLVGARVGEDASIKYSRKKKRAIFGKNRLGKEMLICG